MLIFELYVCLFQHRSTVHGNIRVPICTNHDLIQNMEPILLNYIYLQMHVHPSVSFFLFMLDLPVLILIYNGKYAQTSTYAVRLFLCICYFICLKSITLVV